MLILNLERGLPDAGSKLKHLICSDNLNIHNSNNNASPQNNDYQPGNEGRTVFSKVSYEIFEKYSLGSNSRFKNNFNREDAYNMMINDQYLSRVSEKNVIFFD